MTIIAYKHGVMVADGWEVTGLLHKPCDVGKIRRVSDGGLIGVAGSAVACEAARAMLADGLELRISPVEGDWRDVGRPEDLAAVNR